MSDGFASAMSEALMVVPVVLALGLVAVLFLERPRHLTRGDAAP